MGFRQFSVLAIVVVVFLVMGGQTQSEAAITCNTVASKLAPCIGYLKTGTPSPSQSPCCAGVKALNAMAATTADRQAACRCFKQQSATVNPKPQFVATLPAACGVKLGYTISPSTNCNTVR